MNKWIILPADKGRKRENRHSDTDYMLNIYTSVLLHWKKQIFINQNERAVIKSIALFRAAATDNDSLDYTKILVQFGNVHNETELAMLFEKNGFAFQEDNTLKRDGTLEFPDMISFAARDNNNLKKLLSILDNLSPFSKPMKTAILRFIFPKAEIDINFQKIFFVSESNPFSLFSICLEKVNEDFRLSKLLYQLKIFEPAQRAIIDNIKTINGSITPSSSKESNTGLKEEVFLDDAGNAFTALKITSVPVPSLFNLCVDNLVDDAESAEIEGFSLKL